MKSLPTEKLLNFCTAETTATSFLLIVDCLVSADLKLLEAAQIITFFVESSSASISCRSDAFSAHLLASVSTISGYSRFGLIFLGFFIISRSKSFGTSSFLSFSTPQLKELVNGLRNNVLSPILGSNLLSVIRAPKNPETSDSLVGLGHPGVVESYLN
jgi:hypothetical protein